MNITTFSLRTFLTCCACAAILVGHAVWARAVEPGTITGVRVGPDKQSIAIQHDGQVGSFASFVMQNPYRLVLDINQAQPVRVPPRIPVPGSRISEIRLGYANARTRIVVDFGNNPVPPFRIARGEREMRVILGRGVASAESKPAHSERLAETKRPVPKLPRPTLPQKKSDAAVTVKSTRVDKNRVLLVLASNRHPGKTYVLAVEMDAQDLNVRGATVRDDKGTVKRFQLAEGKDAIKGVRVETVAPWDTMGTPAKESAQPQLSAKNKFKWGLNAAKDEEKSLTGPTKKGALRMEGFVLKPRVAQGS